MTWGNCGIYVLWKRLTDRGSRIVLEWTYTRVPLPRFVHISSTGIKSRFAPINPKRGWFAVVHMIFGKP